jgi:hypothetical protein
MPARIKAGRTNKNQGIAPKMQPKKRKKKKTAPSYCVKERAKGKKKQRPQM